MAIEINKNSVFEIVDKFGDSNWNVRKNVSAELIAAIGDSEEAARDAAFAILEKIELSRSSRDETEFKNILYWSIKTLGSLVKSINARGSLIGIVRDRELKDKYREIAMNELMNFGYCQEFRNELIGLLCDSNWKIRQTAARLLESFPGNEVSDYLISEFYSFTNDDVIYWVLQIIAHQQKERALNFFGSILFSSATNTKLYVILALSEIDVDEAFKLIVDCFDDSSYMIRTQVHQIIDKNLKRCARFVHDFAYSTDFRTRCEAFKFLVKSMDPQYHGMITQMVTSGSTENRVLGLISFSDTFEESIIEFIYQRFSDESWYVRNFAATIMSGHGQAAWQYLFGKYAAENNSNNRYWILICIKNIINPDSEKHITDIFELFKQSKKNEKLQILGIINFIIPKINSVSAKNKLIVSLIEALNDKKWLVRKDASLIIEKFERQMVLSNIKAMNALSPDQSYWLKTIITGSASN
ncbi:MAG TPA: hypothetical protein PK467_07955 [Candidatus Wallbacteria bacterium]|nr:hypothetical protein [Candidatus Wallbacteria bacterium]